MHQKTKQPGGVENNELEMETLGEDSPQPPEASSIIRRAKRTCLGTAEAVSRRRTATWRTHLSRSRSGRSSILPVREQNSTAHFCVPTDWKPHRNSSREGGRRGRRWSSWLLGISPTTPSKNCEQLRAACGGFRNLATNALHGGRVEKIVPMEEQS